MSATPPPLAADLNDGLKRLKMAAMRRLAPELLVTAKTQRWNPEEFLRTLVEAEISSRDQSNAQAATRLDPGDFVRAGRLSAEEGRQYLQPLEPSGLNLRDFGAIGGREGRFDAVRNRERRGH